MELTHIEEQLQRIERAALLGAKTVYTMDEAAVFLGLSKSYIYELVSRKDIPYCKSAHGGRITYFNRSDLEAWATSHRVASNAEVSQQAVAHVVAAPRTGRKGARK